MRAEGSRVPKGIELTVRSLNRDNTPLQSGPFCRPHCRSRAHPPQRSTEHTCPHKREPTTTTSIAQPGRPTHGLSEAQLARPTLEGVEELNRHDPTSSAWFTGMLTLLDQALPPSQSRLAKVLARMPSRKRILRDRKPNCAPPTPTWGPVTPRLKAFHISGTRRLSDLDTPSLVDSVRHCGFRPVLDSQRSRW